MKPDIAVVGERHASFDQMIERWFPLTYVLNNLNRGMGLQDAYPFVLSTRARQATVRARGRRRGDIGRSEGSEKLGFFERIGALRLLGL